MRQLPTLSIRQPFAWLVVHGVKDIENRSRRVRYRGSLLIHASQSTASLYLDVLEDLQRRGRVRIPAELDFPTGGIVGIVDVVDCVRRSASVWKESGEWGWVLANARPLPFRPCRGAVGFFYPKW